MRCLTLARVLADEGWHCSLASRRDMLGQIPLPGTAEFDILALNADDDEPNALRQHWPNGADILIVDQYDLDAEFEHDCRGWANRILVIDDLANRAHDADILIDQTSGRRAQDYDGLVPAHCLLLLGAEYALLRLEFAALRDHALARRRSSPPVQRIMVAVGSTDPINFTSVALDAISRSGLAVEVDVILSSGAPYLARIHAQSDELSLRVRVHVNVGAVELAKLMDQADIAIGSGGITSWERCCLGLPSLVVCIAKNQHMVVASLAREGAIQSLGDAAGVDSNRLADALRDMAKDGGARRDMGLKASQICDGQGAKRVVRALNATLT
jgi:UDP-2,4-diacetamido-2,4,6-trideoxy-beta-L-altropyranose hydrolase